MLNMFPFLLIRIFDVVIRYVRYENNLNKQKEMVINILIKGFRRKRLS